MKNHILALTVALLAAMSLGAKAQILALDTFDEDPDSTVLFPGLTAASTGAASPQIGGAYKLISNGTASYNSTGSPFTVSNPTGTNGSIAFHNSGQDIYLPFVNSTTVSSASVFTGFDINVSTATTKGDYFLSFDGTSGYVDRVFIESSGSGFQIGLSEGSSTGVYTQVGGTTPVLSFGTTYRFVLEGDFSAVAAGTSETETAELYQVPVTPSTTDIASDVTAGTYLSATGTETSAGYQSAIGVAFRQGGTGSAPTLSLDNVVAATDYLDAAVPEPATYATIFAGLLLLGFVIRHRARARA